ncbi:hypothetical protein, partial [Geitlerinema calcuttense]
IGEDEEEIRSTAETMGFVAIHSEADGTMNLCKSCYESDPELNPKPTPTDALAEAVKALEEGHRLENLRTWRQARNGGKL